MSMTELTFFNDLENIETKALVSLELIDLFSYAHQWALAEKASETATLSFSSMLAAMTAGKDPLCGWLRSHLALRGVHADIVTKMRSFDPQPLPPRLHTTLSFRSAFEKAKTFCSNQQTQVLSVRHFMTAYAVVPGYHLKDFLRLRIDRRAWCLELAEHLASKFPDEKTIWLGYAREANPVPSLGYNTDAPEGRDLLNVDREVEAFARLIASRNTSTPLSIGVFGAWGSGKSFFMHRLRKRVTSFAKLGQQVGAKSKFHGQIAQIDFNAWHYSEGNLAASFVNHIFHNLRIAPDEDEELLKKRGEKMIAELEVAKQNLAIREQAVQDAETLKTKAAQAVVEIDQQIDGEIQKKNKEIESATTNLKNAQGKLTRGLADVQTEIDAALRNVATLTFTNLLIRKLDNPEFSKASNHIQELISEIKRAKENRKRILFGLVVIGIGAVALRLTQTNIYTQFIAIAGALGGLAVTAISWLKKLNDIAKTGDEFEAEKTKLKNGIVQEVTDSHEKAISELRTVAADRLAELEKLENQLKELESAPATARLALDELEKQRSLAVEKHAEAVEYVERKKNELGNLTTRTLLEQFLEDRFSHDGYQKELTIFSRIRNDFEKLSQLMTTANEDYITEKVVHEKVVGPPTISRIVLYIDDLDRCPAERVIQVLRLIHLLLAFPLFVCVAAVDPRWINQCLLQAPGLIEAEKKDLKDKDIDDEFGVRATPSDYLEKIFQIPLWLRPVPEEQRAAIARILLDPSESVDEPYLDLAVTPSSKLVVTTSMEGVETPEGISSFAGTRIDPDIISSEELKYLDQLTGLLGGNPRSLKRFVNTYRLVKTALSDVELAVFLQKLKTIAAQQNITNDAEYSPYRICMAQLAVLCTERERALKFVRFADKAAAESSLTDWLSDLESTDPTLAACFRNAFSKDLEQTDMKTFKLWLERTRRYSFYL